MKRIVFPPAPPAPDEQPPRFITPGIYELEIRHVELKQSQQTKNEYYKWELWPLGVHLDYRLFYITGLTEAALWALADLIRGVTGKNPEGEIEFDEQRLVGEQFTAEVITDRYFGNPVSRIKRVIPHGG
jgi:hypothetical protein